MPVIQWDHVQDPLDVDKKKTKQQLELENNPQTQAVSYQDESDSMYELQIQQQNQLIQIQETEKLLKEKLRQQKIAQNQIQAALTSDITAEHLLDSNQSIKSVTLNSSGLDDYFKQQNITNNNRQFDQKRKNERLYEKLLKEQQEREKLAILLMKQKSNMQQPTIVSSYPQRDLQQVTQDSSSPIKSSPKKSVMYATSYLNLQNFEKGLHENSPSQHQLLQKQNGMNQVDINQVPFQTSKKKVINQNSEVQWIRAPEYQQQNEDLKQYHDIQVQKMDESKSEDNQMIQGAQSLQISPNNEERSEYKASEKQYFSSFHVNPNKLNDQTRSTLPKNITSATRDQSEDVNIPQTEHSTNKRFFPLETQKSPLSIGTNVYDYNINAKRKSVHMQQQIVESLEVSPEPRISIDKSQENIKKLKDLEYKKKIEKQNQEKVNEAIRLSKIQKTSSINLNIANQHSLGDPHISPDLVLGTPRASDLIMGTQKSQTHIRHHTMKSIPKENELNNKNILSKKALESLNQTQKIFGFQRMNTKRTSDEQSVRSSLSAGKARKIGGIARRKMARESVRNLLEVKKNFSMREGSLGNSSQSPLPKKEEKKPELGVSSSLAQFEIRVIKPPTPKAPSPEPEEKTPVKKGEEVEIQAKLSVEEKEYQRIKREQEEAKKKMAMKDEYGAIAIQTSSQTLPKEDVSENRSMHQTKKSRRSNRPHPAKNGMSHAGQQLDLGGTENPMELMEEPNKFKDASADPKTRDEAIDARARDTGTDPMVGEKDTDPRVRDGQTDAWKRDGVQQTKKDSHIKIETPALVASRLASRSRPTSKLNNNSRLSEQEIAQINSSLKDGAKTPAVVEKERQDSRSTQMMFEHQFKKRRKSTLPEKVSLPSITNKIDGGEEQIQDRESRELLRMQSMDQGKEKHHKDKSKCQICIRKRAEREARRAAREQQKMEQQMQQQQQQQQLSLQQQHSMQSQQQFPVDFNQQYGYYQQQQQQLQLPPAPSPPMMRGSIGSQGYYSNSNKQFPQQTFNPNYNYSNQQLWQQQSHAQMKPDINLPLINVNGALGYDPQDANLDISKPIRKYYKEHEQKSQPLKYFKGQDLEMHYMEKQLKPEVEKEIKEGFFEIKKKFNEDGPLGEGMFHKDEDVQVYVSHLCLHNFHPIFCKFALETVKIVLHNSSIVYLNKGQTLYAEGFNDQFIYIILFGRIKILDGQTQAKKGQTLNIGWTVGEEILFKPDNGRRTDICRATSEACVLGIEKKNLSKIKQTLQEKGDHEEFMKLEVVLRGNHLVKKDWR